MKRSVCSFSAKILLAVFISLLSAGLAFSADKKPQKNVPSFFKGVRKEVLENGLTIITLNREDSPLVSINIFVNTGSVNEDDRITGISHFCEHLFYRGTEKRTGIAMKKEIEQLGGVFNAETSRDFTRFFVNIPSEYGLEALEIYCDAIKNANYPNESIDQERKVILEEFSLTSQSPSAALYDKVYSMAFSEHPYRRSIIGTVESLKNLKREDFLNYKKTYYSPENMVILLIGKFDRPKYISFIREHFKDMPGGVSSRTSIRAQDPPLKEKKELIESKPYGGSKALFLMGYRGPAVVDEEDVLAMDILVFLLGQGKNSILNHEFRDKRKMSVEISADYYTTKDPGLVLFSGEVPPGDIEKVKESIVTVLFDIKKGSLTDEDVERAKILLLKSFVYTNETLDGKADSLGFYEILKGLNFALDYETRIKSVKREDLVRTANKYFTDKYVLYVLKPDKPPRQN
ncbi:MAG: insulinase family protein [Firmicutes bacterium]|nr:insulinase family protein [Bacillota bacterium]